MSLILEAVTARNFLSIGQATQGVRLDDAGLTLILGENLDSEFANARNGAGKTTLAQAVYYALYGQPLSKIKLDNLVNSANGKGMLVTLDFRVRGKRYRIERGRKPNILRLLTNLDGAEGSVAASDESEGENRHTQTEIERLIGMSANAFRQQVIMTTSTEPFLRQTAADQREFIEEQFGFTLLSERAEGLKARISATKENIRVEETAIRVAEDGNARIEAAIARANEESLLWQQAKARNIAKLAHDIESLGGVDFDAAERAFDALEDWEKRQADLKIDLDREVAAMGTLQRDAARLRADITRRLQPDRGASSLLAELERQKKEAEAASTDTSPPPAKRRMLAEAERKHAEAKRHEGKLDELAARIAGVQEQLEHPDSHHCQTCGQTLDGTDHLETVMASLRAQLAKLTAEAAAELDAVDAAREQAAAAETEAEEVERKAVEARASLIERVRDLDQRIAEARAHEAEAAQAAKREATALEREAAALDAQADEKSRAVSHIRESLASMPPRPETLFGSRDEMRMAKAAVDVLVQELRLEEAREDPHASKASSLRETMAVIDRGRLEALQRLLKHEDLLLKMLTGKDSFLRKRIVDPSLARFNQSLNRYLDLLGLPHEVCFKPDLTVEISLMGHDYDYAQLSRGEQNRVNLALSCAFRDLWEQANHPINLLIVDEVLDSGMDEAGGEVSLSLLRGMALDRGRNVMLISHKEGLIGRVGRVLMVRKEQGFTRFEADALAA